MPVCGQSNLTQEIFMKKSNVIHSLLVMATITSYSALASEQKNIKSCSTELTMPESEIKVQMKIDIIANDKILKAVVTQNGMSYEDEATIESDVVKAGLNGNLDDVDSLNLAEKLITHAMALTEDPIMKGTFSAGLDLHAVRSAKIYNVGTPTNMGMTAIVEAKDENGKDLGSFFGGFLVTPCK
jgi:hypothetical protein